MVDDLKREPALGSKDGLSASWRALIAAWALVILLVVLSTGAEALASRHHTALHKADVAGAVIPRHDPACAEVPTGACPRFASILAQMDRSGTSLW